ncbi:hypothetical protein EHI_149330 [Entamoeba histolytica HM-1:IMSS]|uniref:Histidine acid phosphatase family protein n=2 Tax=Entamoeba TaxID=5758 RepID=B1N604_ENTH1|nr:hypothetical protein EHI_149330 [Entamoeba histolytica HM-1:IMSS]EDS88604.1 hypothetical protein EHI_149330 [Entamoeba histolytica HM-1:IMSS]|eukprot:XP_001914620.1 hypothetical protein EHI_149330 [Entamoeba histolytica HM-1:IMSS]
MLNDYTEALKNKVVYQQYTAHDTTIYGLLALLGEETTQPIQYASTLAFEYYNKADEMYVRVLLNDKVLKLNDICIEVDGMCKYSDFETKMKALIPKYEDCQVKDSIHRTLSRKGWYTYN